ncbi:hypothetical protein BJX70DRAFT_45257 [Aspergillus crustosus]
MAETEGISASAVSFTVPPQRSPDELDTMTRQLLEGVKLSKPEVIYTQLAVCRYPLDRTVIHQAAVPYYNQPVFKMIAACLAARREELLLLARQHLPRGLLNSFGVQPEQRLLDSQTGPVADALMKSFSVDPNFMRHAIPDLAWASSGSSVYCLVGCNREAAQILYDAGFTNVDELDQMMYSPLAGLEIPGTIGYHGQFKVRTFPEILSTYLRMCEWYVERGACTKRVFGVYRATPLHYLAGRIGKCLSFPMSERFGRLHEPHELRIARRFMQIWLPTLGRIVRRSTILEEIFGDTYSHDLFACSCSIGGCLAMNVLLANTFIESRSPPTISAFVALLAQDARCEHVAAIVFRACCFRGLGLPHLCRYGGLSPSSPLQQQDDGAVNVLLNRLVRECRIRFRQSRFTIAKFMMEEWMPRFDALQAQYLRGDDGAWFELSN